MNYKKFLGAASAALMIVIVITLVLAPAAGAASKYKVLYKFQRPKDGFDPWASLIFDAAGNLYGTTCAAAALLAMRHRLQADAERGWKLDGERAALVQRQRRRVSPCRPHLRCGRKSLRHDLLRRRF